MQEKEILEIWKRGLTKNKVAQIYQREYNERIKLERMNVRNRFVGKLISHYEALGIVERVIYNEIKRQQNRTKK